MSEFDFLSTKKVIAAGDLVLVWVSRAVIKPLWMQPGETLQTKFGPFRHDDIIGKRYGSQLPSSTGRGFVHALAPTPELWALSLPHRTQIVYSHDASYIVQRLQIRPDSHVIEAGTGSGAFTHALARAVSRSDARVWTFEYHRGRYEQAITEFKNHGLAHIVHAEHRNVCEDGFLPAGKKSIAEAEKETDKSEDEKEKEKEKEKETKAELKEESEKVSDMDIVQTEYASGVPQSLPRLGRGVGASAVFLDLPAPWAAIPFLLKDNVLDRSQCVQICCFSPCIEQVAKTVEVLQQEGFRSIEMVENQSKRWEGHHGMVRTVDEALNVLRDVKSRRETGLERRKRKRHAADVPEEKRTEHQVKLLRGDFDNVEAFNPWGRSTRVREGMEGYRWKPVSWTESEIKTHTSYLTFAQLPPSL